VTAVNLPFLDKEKKILLSENPESEMWDKGGGRGKRKRGGGDSPPRQREGTEKEKKKKNREHAYDPNADRSNKVNPIQFPLIIVLLYIYHLSPPHGTRGGRKRKPQDKKSKVEEENCKWKEKKKERKGKVRSGI